MKALLSLLLLLSASLPPDAAGLTRLGRSLQQLAGHAAAASAQAPATASEAAAVQEAAAAPEDATTPAAEPPETPEQPITVNLVGDILLDAAVGDNIAKYGTDYPFERTGKLLADADVTFGNLETSVSARGEAATKQFTFRSRPETLQGLVDAGFDGVTVANNHTLDYGVEALQDTIANLDRYKLGHTGAGNDEEEAFQPYVREVRGKKLAILGISRVLPEGSWFAGKDDPGIAQGYSLEPMMSYVKKAVTASDYTIVYMHWNQETKDYPEAYARTYAKKFIDAGVDAVVGAHSHCLQGIEWYKGKPVFYSLGNFIFTSKSEKSSQTMILKLSFQDGETSASVTPARIVDTQARLMDDKYNQSIYAKLNRLSYNAVVGEDGRVGEQPKK